MGEERERDGGVGEAYVRDIHFVSLLDYPTGQTISEIRNCLPLKNELSLWLFLFDIFLIESWKL